MIYPITLPFEYDALMPYISSETVHYHYDKHHATYARNTNDLLKNTSQVKDSLISVVQSIHSGTLFNNAAQTYNHDFYWRSLMPKSKTGLPAADLLRAVQRDFASLDNLLQQMQTVGLKHFGSGWLWLVKNQAGILQVIATANADTPITNSNLVPLLCVDLWEHAYYLDYKNDRSSYLQGVLKHLLNWNFANQNYQLPV